MTKINAISIVDDDRITVYGIKKMLSSLDICNTIETYENGKKAIEAIKLALANKDTLPEIIFLDLNMPIMDGWQFLEEFISLPLKKRVRINIVTSSIDPSDLQKWENFKTRTHHHIEYHNKPIRRKKIAQITKAI